jgi:hypothetical protein
MKVRVHWIKSPRRWGYGIYRKPDSYSLIDVELAKQIRKEHPGSFECQELDDIAKEKPVKVKDTMLKKTYTRPVNR